MRVKQIFQNLGATSKLWASECYHEASFILRIHSSGMTREPYLGISARCMWPYKHCYVSGGELQ